MTRVQSCHHAAPSLFLSRVCLDLRRSTVASQQWPCRQTWALIKDRGICWCRAWMEKKENPHWWPVQKCLREAVWPEQIIRIKKKNQQTCFDASVDVKVFQSCLSIFYIVSRSPIKAPSSLWYLGSYVTETDRAQSCFSSTIPGLNISKLSTLSKLIRQKIK